MLFAFDFVMRKIKTAKDHWFKGMTEIFRKKILISLR